ncbi:restriction endonuclease subunit S [Limosilactobacillus reuteri]|uniref:restriction endonuclease subunit S n=1 Tax=Limosilactobacillus reuteri TaxID=1598 RepID=UPI00298C49D2|nr:restriction endonuclease subunit S [Limosilactobacillus reuteri]
MKYKLSELAQIKYGKDHKKLENGNIPVYGTGGLMRKVNNFLYSGESVLIPRKGSLNNVMFVTGKFWTVDTMFWTKINSKKVLPKYLYYCLSRINLSALNVGSAVPSLTIKILNEIRLDIPSLSKQKEIVKKLAPFERKIRLNNQINANLANRYQLKHLINKLFLIAFSLLFSFLFWNIFLNMGVIVMLKFLILSSLIFGIKRFPICFG